MKVANLSGRMLAMVAATWLLALPAQAANSLDADILDLQHGWGLANYKTAEKEKEAAFKALVDKAQAVAARYPERAEPKVWEAIIRSSYAGALGGLDAVFASLPQVKMARDLLLQAEKIDAKVLNGSIYTTLGSLYYQVPSWPIGFGDKKLARSYLDRALAIAPDDIDANYFMGDFLMDRHKYGEAIPYLQKALNAAPRPNREVADAGRKAEASALLAKAEKKR